MSDWKSPHLTADAILVEDGRILLIKRGIEPFRGSWAIIGGFVNYGERVEDACIRETREEAGIEVRIKKLVGVYSKPGRDPRGHTVSVVYLVERVRGEPISGDDAKGIRFFPLDELPPLAFDHSDIIADAKEKLRL